MVAESTPEVVGRRRSGAFPSSSWSSFEPRRRSSALLQPASVVVEDEGGRGFLLDMAFVHEVAGSAVSTEVVGVNVSRRSGSPELPRADRSAWSRSVGLWESLGWVGLV